MFDEITSGLDEFARIKFAEILSLEVVENPKIYILSTHLFGEISNIAEKETFTNIEIYLIPNCTSLPKSINPKVTFTNKEESNNIILNIDKIGLRYTMKLVAKYSESDKLDIIILLLIVVS